MTIQTRFKKGEFTVFAETVPPKGVDISDLVTNIRHLKSKVDAVVIPDMDSGIMHMSAIAAGSIIRQQGLEPVIHVSSRDRNRIALQGDFLAAHVLGIHNLMVVKAENVINGDHQNATQVDDLNESELLIVMQSLMEGTDFAGFELKGIPQFFPGYQVQPILDNDHLKKELEDARIKIEAGAQYLMIPPVFDMTYYKHILNTFQSLGVPVVASVFMLKNVGMARYISINDESSRLPESLISRVRKAKNREIECITIAGEMIKELKPVVQGVKISAIGWEDRLPAILDTAGL